MRLAVARMAVEQDAGRRRRVAHVEHVDAAEQELEDLIVDIGVLPHLLQAIDVLDERLETRNVVVRLLAAPQRLAVVGQRRQRRSGKRALVAERLSEEIAVRVHEVLASPWTTAA